MNLQEIEIKHKRIDLSTIGDYIFKDIENKLSGKNESLTCGFSEIEELTDSLGRGQLWTIGGFSGTGKSFFILNMIDRIRIKMPNLRIAIFSTELSGKDYLLRYACMKAGIYKRTFRKYFNDNYKKVLKEITEITANKSVLDIYGDISRLEEIQEVMLHNSYDIVFVDFIQNLAVGEYYSEKDTMPIIGFKLKEMALANKLALIGVSQINNYAMQEDYSKSNVSPFSFGKQLNQASHVSILLERKKKEDKKAPYLEVRILKARDGEEGKILYKINNGFNLSFATDEETKEYQIIYK